MEAGTQVFVNWYGHVVSGEVIEHDQHFNNPIFNDWVGILMEIPASDGKPIVAGCHNICAYHKKHVYLTYEAAAEAWREYQQSQQKEPVRATQPAEPVQQTETQPDGEEWLAEYRAFLKAHWNHERNPLQIAYLDEAMKLFRAAVVKKTGYRETVPEPVDVPAIQVPEPIKHTESAGTYAQKPVENIRAASRRKKKQEKPARAIQLMFDF